jgi:hypothetical protein
LLWTENLKLMFWLRLTGSADGRPAGEWRLQRMEELNSHLPAAVVTLDTELLDRIDEIIRPGVNLDPADRPRASRTSAVPPTPVDGTLRRSYLAFALGALVLVRAA